MLGSGIHVYINNHKFESLDIPLIDQGYPDKPVILRRGCWIGANVFYYLELRLAQILW